MGMGCEVVGHILSFEGALTCTMVYLCSLAGYIVRIIRI